MSSLYSPPNAHSLEFNFRFGSYLPPDPHAMIYSFISGEMFCAIDVKVGCTESLTTGKHLQGSCSSATNLTATLTDTFEEAMYADNFMILIV